MIKKAPKRLERLPDGDDDELSIKIKTSEISINVKSLHSMTEAEISNKITTLLLKHGITPWQQQAIPTRSRTKKIGSCDLYIYDKRVIIEVKRVKRLENGPYSSESGDGGRSAFEQLENYIKAERSQKNTQIVDFVEDEIPNQTYDWLGIVTNYKKWWAWTWPPHASEDDGKLQDSFNGVELTPAKERQLVSMLQKKDKDIKPVPEDLGPIFEPHLKRLLELYARSKDYRDTQTQKWLWLKQLEASGNAPDTDVDEVFVRHTLLILVTRLISKVVGNHQDAGITRGFVCWVSDGSEEMKSLEADVKSYDWNHETRDIMRSLYMGFIPKKHRKNYGEYYTPDWLAEKLAMTVIDEKYIAEQLESFQTTGTVKPVLDPACGSGSLLYHAGRFILNSKTITEAREYLTPTKINAFVCSMLYGIDIHPVAVEMAKTNIHRLIQYSPDQHIRVYQGDSLLLNRPTNNVHSSTIADPDDLVLYSPKGTALVLPKLFLQSSESIEILVRTAKQKIKLPAALFKQLQKRDAKKVIEAHKTLTQIVDVEGNGVWEWYIKNQSAPLLLQEQKAGRIVSNPPWVRINQINVKERKALIESEAKALSLWVGGNTATSFDIAALFVDRCSSLYLTDPKKSGWVLIGGALKTKAWSGLRNNAVWKDYRAMWDLGNVAFNMGFSTCVVFFGIKTPSLKLVKKRNSSVKPTEFLSDIRDKTKWKKPNNDYPYHPSGYLVNKNPVAKNGATLFPYNFVRIDEIVSVGKTDAEFKTLSKKGRWEKYGSIKDQVPKAWVRDCIYSQDLYPYAHETHTKCILPMKNNKWDPARDSQPYWRKVSYAYKENKGKGKNTPPTLEKNLNHHSKLTNQFGLGKWLVVYNAGGENMYAMKTPPDQYIIEHGCFYIPCRSESEADYLSAMLNSPAMLPPLNNAKTSDLYFGLSIWKRVPIPKFNSKNKLHGKLAKLSKKATILSSKTYKSERAGGNKLNNWAVSQLIQKALVKDGVAGQIDDLCKNIIDEYYQSVTETKKSYWT